MPIVTITTDTADQAIDIWADCAHRYGIDAVYLVNGDGHFQPDAYPSTHTERDLDDENVEADPTPPHGIERPKRAKKPDVVSVACPYCGAAAGTFCHSVSSGNSWTAYNNGHKARHLARDAAWNNRDD